MNYWLHRISHQAEVAYPLLDNNILTIGFSDFATQTFIDDLLKPATWEERWSVLEEYFHQKWGYQPRNRHSLWRFVEGFRKGEMVLVPTWGGEFSVYELVSDCPKPISSLDVGGLTDWHGNPLLMKDNGLHVTTTDENEETHTFVDLGFYWEVKPVEIRMSRKDYADAALTARMKIRITNTLITELKDSVDKAIEAFKKKKPINLYAQIIEKQSPEILNLITTELDPDKFELLVKFYFEKCGASIAYIPPKNDKDKEGDADVVAVFESIKTMIYAQVKFHKTDSETNGWAVEQIDEYRKSKEAIDDGYSKAAWVISSANAYDSACIKAAQEANIHLIDGARFAEMLLEVGVMGLDGVV